MKDELLGRIPTHGGGVCKTYPESIIRLLDEKTANKVLSNFYTSREKMYLELETNDIYFERERQIATYKELELLSVYPVISGENSEIKYLVEVIEKDILYRHLKEKKEFIESLKEKQLLLDK